MAEQISSAKAEARTVRIAPRKARLVVDLIRGKSLLKLSQSYNLRQELLPQSLKKY